jgi:hypothetical protein
MSGMNIAPGYYQDNQGVMRWWDSWQWTPPVRIVLAKILKSLAETTDGEVGHER